MNVYRPLVCSGPVRPDGAVSLVGGPLWFTHVEWLRRGQDSCVIPADRAPSSVLERLGTRRSPICGLDLTQPHIMGILNVTPDSFSDGGRYDGIQSACKAAVQMAQAGATIIDIGGESTRPGAAFIPEDTEIDRTAPVIRAIAQESPVPISIDTRKSAVAKAAMQAGASLVNDVSGFTFDAQLAPICAKADIPVCVMHAQGDPATMQDAPVYDDVVLDVYDFLKGQIDRLVGLGIPRDRIVVDPGIGFGKTIAHNLSLLHRISVFHGLGCPILLGVSRKGFIGKIGEEPRADARAPGSIALGLAALAQGVQILRVHDVAETAQAVRLWQAVATNNAGQQ